MAPADLSTSASSSYSGINGSTFSSSSSHIKVISNGSSNAPLIPTASSSTQSTTVLSPPIPRSTIKDGRSECYDDVRQLLCSQPPWPDQHQKVLMEPYEHLASRPGKEIRSQMIEAFNIWLKVPDDKIRIIHKVIGMLHTSSLLVDDVEDDSILRRGAPVAHSIFGIPQTINTANYVYFLVFGEILRMNQSEDAKLQIQIQHMIVEEMINLHRGQGMDLYWRDNLICPTESEYIEMVNNKTSGLLRIVIKLMSANSPSSQQDQSSMEMLVPLVNLIGLLFQIRDDYMNLKSGDYAQNKGYCEDLTEGKFSFPLIHSIRASMSESTKTNGTHGNGASRTTRLASTRLTNRDELLTILQSRPKDAATKRKVVEYMEEQTGSFAYSCDVMGRLNRLIETEVAAIEQTLGSGQSNLRLRRILAALRKGWC